MHIFLCPDGFWHHSIFSLWTIAACLQKFPLHYVLTAHSHAGKIQYCRHVQCCWMDISHLLLHLFLRNDLSAAECLRVHSDEFLPWRKTYGLCRKLWVVTAFDWQNPWPRLMGSLWDEDVKQTFVQPLQNTVLLLLLYEVNFAVVINDYMNCNIWNGDVYKLISYKFILWVAWQYLVVFNFDSYDIDVFLHMSYY